MGKKILSIINFIIILISFTAFVGILFDGGFPLVGFAIIALWLWIIELINLAVAIFLFKKMDTWKKINKLSLILMIINVIFTLISFLLIPTVHGL